MSEATTSKKSDKSATKSNSESATKSSDSSTEKSSSSTSSKKSASQSSISHFSSVSTKEYRDGWAAIFGDKKSRKKTQSKKTNKVALPLTLELADDEINDGLRQQLYKAFQKKARKEGVSLAQLKKVADISYTLDCDVREK